MTNHARQVAAVPVADSAAAFRRALLEGQRIAATNLPAVWRGLETFAHMPASTAELVTLPGYP